MTYRRTRAGRIEIREVLLHVGADERLLERLREEGLFEADEVDPREADELRVARLMMEELGVNPAGVQVALHLRRRLLSVEKRLGAVAARLREEPDSRE